MKNPTRQPRVGAIHVTYSKLINGYRLSFIGTSPNAVIFHPFGASLP
ncbi:MAG: hypothetical protein ACPG19_14220 [Saprospiraceae bacterium]